VLLGEKEANPPDQVYLNSGSGTDFTQMSSIPSTSEGQAEFVAPIDYDGNGLSDFLVLKGNQDKLGPVQLIAFFPASPQKSSSAEEALLSEPPPHLYGQGG
jgi:hypothetical protein